jgi:6-phosphogluconolactonase
MAQAQIEIAIHESESEAAMAAARQIACAATEALTSRGRFCLALAGGRSPRLVYEKLATLAIDWPRVHVFWSDERCVPPDSPDSNYALAQAALLARAAIPALNVHRMPAERDDRLAASTDYENALRVWLGDEARFDFVHLGIGPEGHTASLFPGQAALRERERWVVPVTVPKPPFDRLTLTPPILNRARRVMFYALGRDKAPAVRACVQGAPSALEWPAQAIRPDGSVLWILERAAASALAPG